MSRRRKLKYLLYIPTVQTYVVATNFAVFELANGDTSVIVAVKESMVVR